jgi:FSR family fosmidomycin resistance protein-like MFS transporter
VLLKRPDRLVIPAAPARPGIRDKRALAMLALSHVVDDLYLGAIPAILPFLVLERGYSYTSAAGITLAATLVSSVAQPAFGMLADRKSLPLLAPVSLLLVGGGVGLTGVITTYWLVWFAVAIAGIGVAAYHPSAARAARAASGASAQGMSWFALGGNIGLALGPAIATPLLLAWGLGSTPILTIPAVIMATILIRLHRVNSLRTTFRKAAPATPTLADDWALFRRLAVIVILRSIMYYGLSTLMALFVIEELGGSKAIGSATLTTYLAVGAASTLAGGWVADRYGRLVAIRAGYLIIVPALLILLTASSPYVAIIAAALLGVGMYLPFAVQTTLGQEYLPNRIGTASGVTLGLAVSAGGLFAPLFGAIADHQGLTTALALVGILPPIALLMTLQLRERAHDPAG